MSKMKRRAWLLYLLCGALVMFAWEYVPALKIGPLFNAIALSSPVAIVFAVRMWKPKQRAPWYLFALGQTFFVAGDIITYNYQRIFGTELPFPSIGDAAYLAVYPCLIVGILLLVHRHSPGHDRDGFIDSLIVAISVGTVSWVFLMAPISRDKLTEPLPKLISMAYPFMDLMLLTVVIRLAIGAGKRALSLYLMATAAIALFATDFVYTFITVHGTVYNQSGYLEGGWAAFYLLWGASALHPSMRSLSDRAPEREPGGSELRLVILAAASFIAPGLGLIQYLEHNPIDVPVLIVASGAMFLLVLARMAGLVHREGQSALRERALREAGAALVTATDREGIHHAIMKATATLAGEKAAARLLVNLDPDEPSDFTVVATSEDGASDPQAPVVGSVIVLSSLSPLKRGQLETQRWVQVRYDESGIGELLSMPPDARHVFTVPLFLMDELRALLCVGGAAPLSQSTCDVLETLSSQAALALESAALTEDLVRRRSEARFSSLVQNSSDVVIVVTADSAVRYVSPSVERVLGYDPNEIADVKLTELIHPDDKAQVLQFLTSGSRIEDDPRPALTEFRIRHREDYWLYVESQRTNLLHDPNVKGIVLNTRDISERKAFEEQLQHQAFHDPVTALANRALFHDRVEHALERQTRDHRPISVLFMDLDDFKTINDSLGHAVGDRLLQEVGERLKNCLRAADTAARLGGDEFGILLEDGGIGIEAADVAVRIMAALKGPFHLAGKEVFVRASIGIATATSGAEHGPSDAEELLRNADVAMYMAKEAGKSRYQVFESAMHDTALHRLELKADLQRAVDNGEFVLYYQPVIELETGAIIGLEALIRWDHPERGLVPPLEFIPLAEETGLIIPIGSWVLQEACHQAVLLQERMPLESALHMAVNLSARQLQREEIVDEIGAILTETGLDPGMLILEITESVMMKDVKLSVQRLTELKALGVMLAVDDFGTGYSSLNYIQQFPVDILKVDKSFVDAFSIDPRKSALTATIIKLASDLDLRPVAEGIERADQLERLLDLHCDLGQGFYFAKPLPMEGVDELLATRRALAHRETELSS
jgi:diguanylate cyclase (GGDEF)-like protein/PAS domain S-box-containing protein